VRALAEDVELEDKQPVPPPATKPWTSSAGSEDEFTVLSTASLSSASNVCSPLLPPSAVPEDSEDFGEDYEQALSADVFHVGSFKELQAASPSFGPLPAPAIALDEPQRQVKPPGDGFAEACSSASNDRWRKAVLLLFPLQLGCEKYVGEDRIPALLRYFEIPSSLGAMGGRPRMAHFFVGRQEQSLLYVDPHFVQSAVTLATENECNEGSCDLTTYRNLPKVQTIPVEHIDSSISFAFYIRSEAELLELIEKLREIDASEAHAPIRVEDTRPAALRDAQGVGRGACANWSDGDLVLEDGEEDDLFQEDKPAPSVDSPVAGLEIRSCTVPKEFCSTETQADLHSVLGGTGSKADRSMCIGPSWSVCQRPWGDVQSFGQWPQVASHP
jgi:hypothetical protein